MNMNFLAIIVAALATLPIGFIWYNPKVFGTIWMRETGMTEEKAKQSNMLKVFGMTIFFGILIAFTLQFMVIHQWGAAGMVGGDPSIAKPSYDAFMTDYGTAFRTFKHGALHGFMTGLLFVLPVVGINAMFEQKSWKYILVTGGYWVICCMLMGGIVCGWQ